MKSIGIIIAAVIFASCHSSTPPKTINDTSAIAYRLKGSHARDWKGGLISYSISKSNDTFNMKSFQTGDTMRTPTGKPIYDSINKVYHFNTFWAEIPDSNLKRFEIIILPK